MGKIVFFSIPAYGHTNPTLGVIKELIKRGHEVTYYSYEMMRERIEETGASFVPCDAYDPQVSLSRADVEKIGKDIAFSTNLIVDMTLALDDAVLQDMEAMQPDVIVSDSMAFWGKLIANKLNIPFVSSTTTFAFNQHSAKVLKQGGPGLFSVVKSMSKVNKSLKKLQNKGYSVKSVLDIIANDNDTKTIVYTSALFQPFAETFSDNYAFVGPILRPVKKPLEKTEQPTIYIALGTVDNDHSDFYQNCLNALGNQPYRVILSVGDETDIHGLGNIPANCQMEHTVDQVAVLQQTDAFITHCGMNSVSEALYYGVPLLMLPLSSEQQGVANRVIELNAGISLEDTTPDGIRDAVQRVLDRSNLRDGAAAIQESFRQCGGSEAAADLIENQIGAFYNS